MVGATLGAVPATPGYFQRIREICDRYGVLFIADEVMTGFGRTGRRWGLDHWGVIPDLIVCAKGISGGYAPLGAVLAKPEFVGEVRSRSGSFVIGHTSSGNPLSCAVGAAVLRYILRQWADRERGDASGRYFKERLLELAERHEMIGDVRGLGLLLGVELVRDRATKEPFPPAWGVATRVGAATLERGLVSYPGTGTADGVAGDHLLYAPPLIITREQVDEMVRILDESLTAVAMDLAAVRRVGLSQVSRTHRSSPRSARRLAQERGEGACRKATRELVTQQEAIRDLVAREPLLSNGDGVPVRRIA